MRETRKREKCFSLAQTCEEKKREIERREKEFDDMLFVSQKERVSGELKKKKSVRRSVFSEIQLV